MSALLGYVRVSTDEQGQSGLGLAAQRAALEAEAVRRGGVLETIYEDVASGGKANRPGWKACRDHAARTRGTILAFRLDRITRRGIRPMFQLLDEAERDGYGIHCLDAPVDFSTSAGELYLAMVSYVAGEEWAACSSRSKATWAYRKALDPHAGEQPHRRCGTDAIERMTQLRGSGQTLGQIAATMQDEGYATAQGGQWRASTVKYLLDKHERG